MGMLTHQGGVWNQQGAVHAVNRLPCVQLCDYSILTKYTMYNAQRLI